MFFLSFKNSLFFATIFCCIFLKTVIADTTEQNTFQMQQFTKSLTPIFEQLPPLKVNIGMDTSTLQGVGQGIHDAFGPEGTGKEIISAAAEGIVRAGTQGFSDAFSKNSEHAYKGGKSLAHYQGQALKGYSDEFDKTGAPYITNIRDSYLHAVGFNYGSAFYYSGMIAVGVALVTAAVYGIKAFFTWVEYSLQQPDEVVMYKSKGRSKSKSLEHPSMIFHESVEKRLEEIIKVTKKINKIIKGGGRKRRGFGNKGIQYRNLLLTGEPGTGKTMFARALADATRMDFVEISASSFFKKGAGITLIDRIFSWAEQSKGLIIFIDEADALFGDRNKLDIESDQYKIICHLLNYLGDRSERYMIVLATNYPVVFDKAMHRRIDDFVKIPLPNKKMRYQVLSLYNQQYSCSISDENLMNMALQTEGLSNGDLAGIINMIQTDAAITEDDCITNEIIDRAVERYMHKLHAFDA